jgi:hypothetical protein
MGGIYQSVPSNKPAEPPNFLLPWLTLEKGLHSLFGRVCWEGRKLNFVELLWTQHAFFKKLSQPFLEGDNEERCKARLIGQKLPSWQNYHLYPGCWLPDLGSPHSYTETQGAMISLVPQNTALRPPCTCRHKGGWWDRGGNEGGRMQLNIFLRWENVYVMMKWGFSTSTLSTPGVRLFSLLYL